MKHRALILCILITVTGTIAKSQSASKDAYLKMASYLSKGEGIWTTPNPGYDSTQKYSPYAIQLNFFWDEERQVLWDSVTLKFKQLDYVTWISTWAWHPEKKIIEYTSYGPEGRLIAGETRVTSEKQFITTDKMFEPDGSFKELKDENFIESENVHSNISYEMKDGQWEKKGSYTWERKK